ncbi:MAG TPA: hypothetical protein VM577_07075, partial [Anaerovoracaceae bacterium]|nr:hypothetical protein [Anaerovoracaceae bacterium]
MMNMETQNGELVRLFLQSIHIKNQQIQTALEEIQTFSKMVAPQIKHFLDYSASGKISINIGECGPGYYCPESLEATLLQYKPIGKQATSILDLPCSGLSTAITEDSRVQLGKSRYAETGFNQILQDIAQGKLPREQALAELLKATKAKSHWHGTSTIALDGKPAYRRTLGEDISYLTHEELQGIRQYYATWLHRKLT